MFSTFYLKKIKSQIVDFLSTNDYYTSLFIFKEDSFFQSDFSPLFKIISINNEIDLIKSSLNEFQTIKNNYIDATISIDFNSLGDKKIKSNLEFFNDSITDLENFTLIVNSFFFENEKVLIVDLLLNQSNPKSFQKKWFFAVKPNDFKYFINFINNSFIQ